MPSAAYFRRQADICLRLSLIASDDGVSNRLITMAREYMATSEALDRETGIDPPSMADRSASPDDDANRDPPDLAGASDMPGSGAES
jgi:hypothetical protein